MEADVVVLLRNMTRDLSGVGLVKSGEANLGSDRHNLYILCNEGWIVRTFAVLCMVTGQ